ncbi:hypothetical protein K438DRAFT_1802805 [Mycena galopus ATCC 62051]|nr:hypothetical protein K438DRAFT_1802805 [Mycena galopus ATCC 62051]
MTSSAQPHRQPRVPASAPPGRSHWVGSSNPAPSSSASQRTAQNTPSRVSTTVEDLDLTLALHTLAVIPPILSTIDSKDNESRVDYRAEALAPIFPTKSAQDKFIDVLQAIIAICTALPGPDNVAAMLACAPEYPTIKLFLCQNGGLPFGFLQRHLEKFWDLLRRIRPISLFEHAEITSPRQGDDADADLIRQLNEQAHTFVVKKLLKRLTSKFSRVDAFYKMLAGNGTVSIEQEQLLLLYLSTTQVAGSVDLTQDLETQSSWRALHYYIPSLYKSTRRPSFADNVDVLQTLVPPDLYFDLGKGIKKAVKVQAAIITLADLARSPNRGWIVNRDIQVYSVPLPKDATVQVPFKAFRTLCPTANELYSQLTTLPWKEEESDETPIKITRKIHSECQLAVVLFEDKALLDGAPLIPYMSCSKQHCYFCYQWMHAVNNTGTRLLGFDGTHGTVYRGWHPPTLQDPAQQRAVIERLKFDATRLIRTHSSRHEKETSCSSTSSNSTASEPPEILVSDIGVGVEIMQRIAAEAKPVIPSPPAAAEATAASFGSSPPTAASIALGTPQALPRSWANLAATNSQKWGSIAKQTAPGTTEVLESTQSVPQPPGASTSGPDLNVPQSSPHPELTDPRCFVGGVSKDITQAMLSSRMQRYGTLNHINIIRTKKIAFVEFTELEGARQAISASTTSHGVWLDRPQGGRARLTIETSKRQGGSTGRDEDGGGFRGRRGRGGAMRGGGAATPGGR